MNTTLLSFSEILQSLKDAKKINNKAKVLSNKKAVKNKVNNEVVKNEIKNEVKQTIESAQKFIIFSRNTKNRTDEINAISEFMGAYNYGKPHGTQLDLARMIARRILFTKNIMKETNVPYCKSSISSIDNYVPGMPDNITKNKRNIEANIINLIDEKRFAYYSNNLAECAKIDRQIISFQKALDRL